MTDEHTPDTPEREQARAFSELIQRNLSDMSQRMFAPRPWLPHDGAAGAENAQLEPTITRRLLPSPMGEPHPRPEIRLRPEVMFPQGNRFHLYHRTRLGIPQNDNAGLVLDMFRTIIHAMWVKELAKGIAQGRANKESKS